MHTKTKSISTHSFTSALFQIRFFNIFHPLDPVAYRVEPLLMPHLANEPPAQTGSVGEDADAGPKNTAPLRMDWVLPSAAMNSAAQLLQEGMAGGWARSEAGWWSYKEFEALGMDDSNYSHLWRFWNKSDEKIFSMSMQPYMPLKQGPGLIFCFLFACFVSP